MKKWPIAHVSNHRDRTKRCMMISFAFADRYDPKQVFIYLGYDLKQPRKFFHTIQTQTLRSFWSKFSFIFNEFSLWNPSESLKITLNRLKSSIVNVSCHKISTSRRMITLFVSADRYDPKEVFSYLGYGLEPSRKFFRDIPS